VLDSLEHTRERLGSLFPRLPPEITVVLHRGRVALTLTNPLLAVEWATTAPANRRYVAGWAGRRELHVLAPATLLAQASSVPGSREMLEHAPAALYARRVIAESNRDLARVMRLIRLRRELRWAWLLEGAARWFGGQTGYARPAIARRLREGRVPFPPGLRDAPLLGGTLIDLLACERGERAAAALSCRLHPRGPGAALVEAFGGPPLREIESAWREHLVDLAG
jgi:hypothetical protein